jgi:hypothetical protein
MCVKKEIMEKLIVVPGPYILLSWNRAAEKEMVSSPESDLQPAETIDQRQSTSKKS